MCIGGGGVLGNVVPSAESSFFCSVLFVSWGRARTRLMRAYMLLLAFSVWSEGNCVYPRRLCIGYQGVDALVQRKQTLGSSVLRQQRVRLVRR